MKKLAIISTHPIQYNAPAFRMLAQRSHIKIKVFYTWENSKNGVFDKKFNKKIKWDIPLLEGYEYQFIKNISSDQGTHHRKGIINPTLNAEIEAWGANAVLVYGWNFESHFKAMRYFKGKIPVLFRGDSTLMDEKPGFKTILRRIALKFVYRYIDYALYVGTHNKNYYLKHGINEKQLIYAPHTVDNERFYDSAGLFETKATSWKKELKINENDLVFLFAGKFENKKDPLLLIQAAKNLNNANYKFIFAGDGELKSEMLESAKNFSNILFLPFQNQSQMPVLYRLADVFVLPSKGPNETWGLAINEAMACGRAILGSTKVGGNIDLVENGKNGYIFEAGNLEDFIENASNFTKKNVESFGNKSLKIVENHSFIKFCSALEKLITETM
ncbi:MAG: glycosyltransferase family 4 protein [Bacteroidales bacterium]|nr:glycosyltransferase family 4 protein [Bacteroidales bacterium]